MECGESCQSKNIERLVMPIFEQSVFAAFWWAKEKIIDIQG
jgi:hypothetical protein